MIKNPWPFNFQGPQANWAERVRSRPNCIYPKRFNLYCYAPREKCRTCYMRQEASKSSEVIHVCDRCGYETNGADDKLTYITVENREGGVIATAELCEACAHQLGEWLHNEDFFHNFYDECPG